eukprot:scaffold32710_cov112-Isochrysis_galbana.AAC.3
MNDAGRPAKGCSAPHHHRQVVWPGAFQLVEPRPQAEQNQVDRSKIGLGGLASMQPRQRVGTPVPHLPCALGCGPAARPLWTGRPLLLQL